MPSHLSFEEAATLPCGLLRHAVYLGEREDKAALMCDEIDPKRGGMKLPRTPCAVVFDMDGLLFDTETLYQEA